MFLFEFDFIELDLWSSLISNIILLQFQIFKIVAVLNVTSLI